MRTILIDPLARTVSTHTYNGNWRSIAPAIGAQLFDVIALSQGDLYIDDEGALNEENASFIIGSRHVLGSALLFGPVDPEGDSTECTLSIQEVQDLVSWARRLDF